ncbi:histidine triad nucleotide-binding protein [Nakamurella antarctica]|uniref:Histidine triad nucleotide-binding protein n=2 Tax=Nakamurella antarctica TaxID=1902245 RepID=A0A3G8ZVB3_9ACTN|nr:histidine triad nucleotide-binding protein [Nakamurella antarctica]
MSVEEREFCVFCAIAAGDLPADIVSRSDDVLAFRDLAPKAPTHILLIPTEHYANAAELACARPATAAQLISMAASIAAEEGVGDGYRLIFNTGEKGGQTVFHAHLHLLAGRGMPGF